jgi:hypothetical protein
MTLEEFRITHSTLIEHYQFIEAHLEGIYAAISGKSFHEGIKDVEKDSLSGVIREIREVEREKGITVLSADTYNRLRQMVERRNFWCHCCYFDLVFDRKTGGPAKVRDVHQLFEDLRTAETWREQLFQTKIELLKKIKKN